MFDEELVLNSRAVITGFCYAFTAALLQKLKELKRVGTLYVHDDNVNAMTATVVNYLSQQVNFDKENFDGITGGHAIPPAAIDGLIDHTEEFLAMFTTKRRWEKIFSKIRQLELEDKLYTKENDDEVVLNTLGAACLTYAEEHILGSLQKHYEGEVISVDAIFNFFSETRQFIAIFNE